MLYQVFKDLLDRVIKGSANGMRIVVVRGKLYLGNRLRLNNVPKDNPLAKACRVFRPNIVFVFEEPSSSQVMARVFLDSFGDERIVNIEIQNPLVKKLKNMIGSGTFTFSSKGDRLIIRIHEKEGVKKDRKK